MAASVEFNPERVLEGEVYGHSQRGSYEVGVAVVSHLVEVQGLEEQVVIGQNINIEILRRSIEAEGVTQKVEQYFADFVTGTDENITTDKDFGEWLVLGRPKIRKKINGKTVDPTGRPIIDIVETGAAYSAEIAKKDIDFTSQAFRDKGDVAFMEIVDDLRVGEVAHAVSMDPKEHLKKDPKKWTQIGYYEGMAVQHIAYRIDEDTVLMWTNIIKQSDKAAFSKIYKEDYGQDIDENTHSDLWIRHVHRSNASRVDVDQIGRHTLDRHKKLIGSNINHYSVADFVDENMDLVRGYFDTYALPLAISHATGKNSTTIQNLARQIYDNVEGMTPSVMKQLMKVSNSSNFDSDSARVMQAMIRYALVEDLRKKLPEFIQRMDNKATEGLIEIEAQKLVSNYIHNFYSASEVQITVARRSIDEMHRLMALNIQTGVSAGRNPGGCSPINIVDVNGYSSLTEPYNDLFSRIEKDEKSEKLEDCEFVSKECPKCGTKDVKTVCKDGKFTGECGCVSD